MTDFFLEKNYKIEQHSKGVISTGSTRGVPEFLILDSNNEKKYSITPEFRFEEVELRNEKSRARQIIVEGPKNASGIRDRNFDKTMSWPFVDYKIYDLTTDPELKQPLFILIDKEMTYTRSKMMEDNSFIAEYDVKYLDKTISTLEIKGLETWEIKEINENKEVVGNTSSKSSSILSTILLIIKMLPEEFQKMIPFDIKKLFKQKFEGIYQNNRQIEIISNRNILAKSYDITLTGELPTERKVINISSAALIAIFSAKQFQHKDLRLLV